MTSERVKVPVREGFFALGSSGEGRLLGSRCPACGELLFPRKASGVCIQCQNRGLEDVELGPSGRLVAFSTVMQPPAGGFYHGPVPYSYGMVDLDDGIRVESLLAGGPEQLSVGMPVELEITTLYEDQDKDVQVFRFRPAAPKQEAAR